MTSEEISGQHGGWFMALHFWVLTTSSADELSD